MGATGTTRAHLLEKAQVISELGPRGVAVLKETLYGFARADMNLTRAASQLLIHENTLRYRLRRIRDRSGYNPQTFDGLLELICLLEVLDHEAPASGATPVSTRQPRAAYSERASGR